MRRSWAAHTADAGTQLAECGAPPGHVGAGHCSSSHPDRGPGRKGSWLCFLPRLPSHAGALGGTLRRLWVFSWCDCWPAQVLEPQ